jgi:hypothetical protein
VPPEPPAVPGLRKRLALTFGLLREHDRLALPLMAAGFAVPLVALVLAGVFTGQVIVLPVLGVLLGLLGALVVFNLRSRHVMFGELEGRVGAALQVIQSSAGRRGGGLTGTWHVSPAVQLNQRQDMVHRLVSRCGVVLVAEGQGRGVRDLLANEVRRVRRAAGDAPVTDVIVGNGVGEVPLPRLVNKLNRLPRALGRPEVDRLHAKLDALPASNIPLPKGPMPTRVPRGRMR